MRRIKGEYKMEQRELWIESTLDGTLQPSLFYGSASEEKRPLLVGLHTWSFDRFNQVKNMLPFAEKNDFNLLLPNFRGNNKRKNPDCVKACGSEFAKQDIQDAIDYVIENENVDRENVFLLGRSLENVERFLSLGNVLILLLYSE